MEQVRKTPVELYTERLILRVPVMDDAERITELCSNWNVSRLTANIPHPYSLGDARKFIADCKALSDEDKVVVFAVLLRESHILIGVVSTRRRPGNEYELGYWFGEQYWGVGYASEAVASLIDYLRSLGPSGIFASFAKENGASERVLIKAGFVSTRNARMKESKALGRLVNCCCLELPL